MNLITQFFLVVQKSKNNPEYSKELKLPKKNIYASSKISRKKCKNFFSKNSKYGVKDRYFCTKFCVQKFSCNCFFYSKNVGYIATRPVFFKFFFTIFVQIEMTVDCPGAQKLKRISQKMFLSREKNKKNRKFQL